MPTVDKGECLLEEEVSLEGGLGGYLAVEVGVLVLPLLVFVYCTSSVGHVVVDC